MRNLRTTGIIFLMTILFSFTFQDRKVRVYLIGDSTMSDKAPGEFPETGWGTPFRSFFDSTVTIDNRAKNGRSSRTFSSEGLWRPVANALQEGDYVFIQFGHNDESKAKMERYSTPEEFKNNLVKYISETRDRKATPVLLTPVTRRRFKEGKVIETHKVYSELVREVAKEQQVHFIDLDAKSRELVQKFGEDHSKILFLHLQPGEHPNFPNGKTDDTHFSEVGARLMAQLILQEIIALRLELADRIVKPLKKT